MVFKQFPAVSVQCALLCALACSPLSAAPGAAGTVTGPDTHTSVNRLDKAWKRYRNSNLGYCVNYPSRWTKEMAFDGTGLVVETGKQKFSKPMGEIDMGLLSLPTSEDARLKPASLSNSAVDELLLDEMKDHIAGLEKLMRVERMETVDQHSMRMQGNSALFVKNKYYDPLERSNWTEELIFVKRQDGLFRLELQCETDQVKRFEPVFANVVNTLQFDCK
jgi:hypothetical protein